MNADHEKNADQRRSKADWEGKYKRARADYINLERRVKEQQEEFVKFANSVLVLKLLPVLDDLEKTVENSDSDGLNLVLKNFEEVLKSEGVEEIEVKIGDKFDPNIMECVITEYTEDTEGTEVRVGEVLRKGYKIKEKALRPAQVRVGEKDAKDNRN